MIFDPQLLRTLLAFSESGTLARAAQRVGRSASAVTSQMQQLEAQVGEPLLVARGRGRMLTPTGLDLAGHARRILDAHHEAWLSLSGSKRDGAVTIGATQDFTQHGLPKLISLYARTHPRVRLNLRIGRSVELDEGIASGALDLAIAARSGSKSDEVMHWDEPAIWLMGSEGLAESSPTEVPLALLDPPCGFRTAAIESLDRARRAYRIAAGSQSLSGLTAALRAGLAVTLRTRRSLSTGLVPASSTLDLPSADPFSFVLRLRKGAGPAAGALADLMKQKLPASDLEVE